ncbi:uncharacterized protein LOC125722519, partial [Brienomyrus brachyistius]|uniref:uncharacterized protein LOC125722519 n=1 Tax=Brienomyrus brachyistius TaxID=42636 RepID=UPI0020B45BB6
MTDLQKTKRRQRRVPQETIRLGACSLSRMWPSPDAEKPIRTPARGPTPRDPYSVWRYWPSSTDEEEESFYPYPEPEFVFSPSVFTDVTQPPATARRRRRRKRPEIAGTEVLPPLLPADPAPMQPPPPADSAQVQPPLPAVPMPAQLPLPAAAPGQAPPLQPPAAAPGQAPPLQPPAAA